MPRYFFHVCNHTNHVDDVGTEFLNDAEARKQSVISAGEMIKEDFADLLDSEWRMIVTTEDGDVILKLRFSARTA